MSYRFQNFLRRYSDRITVSVILLIGFGISFSVSNQFLKREKANLFSIYRAKESLLLTQTKENVQDIFDVTYDALRTMALLPGVQKIDRQGKNLSADSKVVVQQLYNSIATHMDVSEIYIVPLDLDPEKMDPVTHEKQKPIITFDHVIVGKNVNTAEKKNEKLEEVEIFEYREMVKQLQYFKDRFPLRSSFEKLNFPGRSSPELITCDNREFSIQQLEQNRNQNRMGIVYSLPFYDEQGRLKGLVSAIIRTNIFKKALKSDAIALRNLKHQYQVGHWQGEKISPFDVFDALNLETHDEGAWDISIYQSSEHFFESDEFQKMKTLARAYLVLGILFTFFLALTFWLLYTTRIRAEKIASDMTLIAEERQKALVQSYKMSALGEMASGIAHEINNPLAIIIGKTVSLQRKVQGLNLAEKVDLQDGLSKIEMMSNRISKIVKSLKTFSRNAEVDPKVPTSIHSILEETLVLCQDKIESAKVECLTVVEPGLEHVPCRPTEISQVLLNLISNACDALVTSEEKWIRVKLSKEGDQVLISIQDSGPGIPQELREKIMSPFFTTKEAGKGTGLGLSISKKIIEAHGGTLELNPDKMSTEFLIRLPLGS